MIVNETAKFENPLIPRLSSWAYPSSWSRSTSDVVPADVFAASSIPNPLSWVRRCDCRY